MHRYPKSMLHDPSPQDVATLDSLVEQMVSAKAAVELAREELKRAQGGPARTASARERLRLGGHPNPASRSGLSRGSASSAGRKRTDSRSMMKGAHRHETPAGDVVELELAPKIKPPAGMRQELLGWLDANGHGDVASQLRAPTANRSGDHTALGQLARRLLESGKEFPWELFGLSQTHVARLRLRRRSA